MRVFGFLIIQLLALSYTACKTAFYFNEANGALKRAGASDHRFDQGNQTWEKLIFGIIILFSAAFALSNQITISKEMKRIMSPNLDDLEENEAMESEQTYKTKIMTAVNATGKILSIPSSLWKTTVATQSLLRLLNQLLRLAINSENASLGISIFLAFIAFIAALFCNYVFFKEKKPIQRQTSIIDEDTPLLVNKRETNPGCYAFGAHVLGAVLGLSTTALYTNSLIYFPPHMNEEDLPLTSFKNSAYTAGFASTIIGTLTVGVSTYRAYLDRLLKEWIPEQQCAQRSNEFTKSDAIDLVGSVFKAVISCLSLVALTSSSIGLEEAIVLAAAVFLGNALGEAGTFLRKSPSILVRTGRLFGIHDNKLSSATISKISDDEDSAIERDIDENDDIAYQVLA